MPTILVAGAGKSSSCLIDYLINNAAKHKWNIIVADGNLKAIEDKTNGHQLAQAVAFDITNTAERQHLVKQADLVVSVMPPHLHILLAKDCLQFKKNLITSSYISPEIKELNQAAKDAGLMFMCEMGLDPGIDHMTASQIIHSIQRVASTITSFKSYCGGLIAPESDDNPWHYKFTWNPKNIITAGVDGAHYLYQGKEVTIPYAQLFENNKKIKVEGHGSFAYYANRDSLKYLETYEVSDIATFMRATLRHPDFCKGWNAIIKLGLTNEKDNNLSSKTYSDWLKTKTNYNNTISLQEHTAQFLNIDAADSVMTMLSWLGLFEENNIKECNQSSGAILLDLLLDKWQMKEADKDMVVMQHEVEYLHRNTKITLVSSMVVKGENQKFSAMAKTVGLPMAVLAKLILTNRITVPTGVHIPNMSSVYRPVLNELRHHGISFEETIR
jgi:saccharopine dehydrogenase-like NADP-dependent oxidoreductase